MSGWWQEWEETERLVCINPSWRCHVVGGFKAGAPCWRGDCRREFRADGRCRWSSGSNALPCWTWWGALQSDRSRRHLSKVAAADPPLQPLEKTVPPLSVQMPLTLLESQLQLSEPDEPTWLPHPLNNKELYTNMCKKCGTLKDYIL